MKPNELERMLDSLLPAGRSPQPAEASAGPCGCGGSGFVASVDDRGNRLMRECSCRAEARIDKMLTRAEIPDRYRQATLDSFDALGGHPTLGRALATARRFVQEYPIGTQGRGMLLVGSVGIGKTHLAAGMLRALMLEKGARGKFADFRELQNRIKRTFNDRSLSEAEVVDPIFAADVLVLDELGAAQMTEWSTDTVERIINGRYNDNKTTIITTNLPNAGPGAPSADAGDGDYASARRVMRGETLGDRIGARMHSRLQEMCRVVEMSGEDYRLKKGKR